MRTSELATPALIVDAARFEANVAAMAAARPGPALRPHVKAFKSTALARRLHAAGHTTFCGATVRELEGMAAAGLGEDLLLANEVLDARRLGPLVAAGARVTVAVDSPATVEAAGLGGVREVLIDVNIGLPRCGCEADEAGALADLARRSGLAVRGVMGYEGHLVGNPDRRARTEGLTPALELLRAAHDEVGGDVVSGGGTGTYDLNTLATEIQAGSYLLMDTAYATLGLPFTQALSVLGTVISGGVSRGRRYAVADVGLKSLGMDHGNPRVTLSPDPPAPDTGDPAPSAGSEPTEGKVWFCSDEHLTFAAAGGPAPVGVGERVRVWPAHVDPTVALHEVMWVVDGDDVVDRWPVDLRGW